jgi:hypothetical protein
MQAQWTPRLVQQRLRESFATELRLPETNRPRGMASAWPASPVHDFSDMVSWPDARERVWKDWERAKGAYPHEVSRMEEAQRWLSWLEEGERRALAVWALTAARGIPVRKVLRQRRWAPTTFYRKRDIASAHIARYLAERGVAVR